MEANCKSDSDRRPERIRLLFVMDSMYEHGVLALFSRQNSILSVSERSATEEVH